MIENQKRGPPMPDPDIDIAELRRLNEAATKDHDYRCGGGDGGCFYCGCGKATAQISIRDWLSDRVPAIIAALEERDRLRAAVYPCISGSGRPDGHMVYVKSVDGKMVCAFCGRDESHVGLDGVLRIINSGRMSPREKDSIQSFLVRLEAALAGKAHP